MVNIEKTLSIAKRVWLSVLGHSKLYHYSIAIFRLMGHFSKSPKVSDDEYPETSSDTRQPFSRCKMKKEPFQLTIGILSLLSHAVLGLSSHLSLLNSGIIPPVNVLSFTGLSQIASKSFNSLVVKQNNWDFW